MRSERRFDLPEDLFAEEEPRSSVQRWATSAKSSPPPPPPKRRRVTVAASAFAKSLDEVEEALRSGDWSGTRATHLVALYAILHETVYGVEAADLGPRERAKAALMAGTLVQKRFGGDHARAVAFLSWVWERVEDREEWRIANGRQGGRIGWPLQFSSRLVPDYELWLARSRGGTSS